VSNFQHVCRQKTQGIKYNSPVRSAEPVLPASGYKGTACGWE